jgi:hypothetical protein
VEVAVVVEKIKSTVGAEVAESVDALVQYAKVLLMPPERVAEDDKHVVPMAKQPPESEMPTFDVLVAEPAMVSPESVVVPNPSAAIDRNLVESADEATWKAGMIWPAVVWTEKRAKGEEVPMPTAPWKVLVAVVVERREPTATWEEVAAILVPSNHRRADESAEAFVPPFTIGRMPETSAVSEMREVETAPAVAFRNPAMLEMVRPPPVRLSPPAMVEVAVVLVASMVPVKRRRAWMPPR